MCANARQIPRYLEGPPRLGKKKGNQQPEGKGGLLQDTQVDGSYQYLTHLELQGGKEKEKGNRQVNAGRMQSERPVFAYVCLISR